MEKLLVTLGMVSVLWALSGCRGGDPGGGTVGYVQTPLLAPLFAAGGDEGSPAGWELRRFSSSGETGSALLAGLLDAGFLEPDRLAAFFAQEGSGEFAVHGVIEFPSGATLVLRKGYPQRRLSRLAGARVAVGGRECRLLASFTRDALRLGLDPAKLDFISMPFAAMPAALEAGSVDAALCGASHAGVAQAHGHQIVYQNWEPGPPDACCPPMRAQVQYVLVARQGHPRLAGLLDALDTVAGMAPREIRRLAAAAGGFREDVLAEMPLASFRRGGGAGPEQAHGAHDGDRAE